MSGSEQQTKLTERRSLWTELADRLQQHTEVETGYTPYERLQPQHIPIFMLRVEGATTGEIAETLGMSRITVSQILRSKPGKALLAELYTELGIRADVNGGSLLDRIQEVAPEALETTVEVMRTGRDDHRLKAALSILDRAGYGAVQKVERTDTKRLVIEDDRADLIHLALAQSSEIADAEFEIVTEEVPADE